jgi:endonuclease/exonuclease/phosphatase family metal-dependent hydrolase
LFPAPRTDLVPRLGTDDALDIATWNIENFPASAATPRLAADLIASMDLDIVAVEEVADIAAWNELVARLPDHDGLLSTDSYSDGSYQKVGILYRSDLLQVGASILLFDQDGYEFPRPPLSVPFTADDGQHAPVDFVLVALHLKAGFSEEDRFRREAAIGMMEQHVRTAVDGAGDDDMIILGDFNEVITSAGGIDRFAPFLSDPARYDFRTNELASSGAMTFLPSGAILDHIISTVALRDEFAGGQDRIPRLDEQFDAYLAEVSDHLPVVSSMPIWR